MEGVLLLFIKHERKWARVLRLGQEADSFY